MGKYLSELRVFNIIHIGVISPHHNKDFIIAGLAHDTKAVQFLSYLTGLFQGLPLTFQNTIFGILYQACIYNISSS